MPLRRRGRNAAAAALMVLAVGFGSTASTSSGLAPAVASCVLMATCVLGAAASLGALDRADRDSSR